jgi:hypothetical protein
MKAPRRYGRSDAAPLQVVYRSMKTTLFVAGLMAAGLSVLLGGARAGPLGGGFRGGSRAFTRQGLRFPSRGRFFVHHRRYPVISVLGFDALGLPGVYPPSDGYLYDYPGGDYGVADAGSESTPLPAVVQSEPVQGGYRPNPVYIVINTGGALPATSTDGGPGTTGGYRPAASVPQETSRLQEPNGPAGPGLDRPAPAPSPSPGAPGGVFDNLALVSWFNENGKDTVLVENTQTKDVREITSEPNKDNLRIVAVHPNINPNLSEVVISDGTDQRAIRFHSEGAP